MSPSANSQQSQVRARGHPDNQVRLQPRGSEVQSTRSGPSAQSWNSTATGGRGTYAAVLGRAPATTPAESGSRGQMNNRPKTLIGRSVSTSPSNKITAAKPYVGKSVFCVDNVSTAVTTSELCAFVARHVISVISCFETIPRRSHKQKLLGFIPSDRKAFRLCIAREDCDKLLNSDIWPAHVTVSRWLFSRKEQSTEHADDTTVNPAEVTEVTQRDWTNALLHAVSEAQRAQSNGPAADHDDNPVNQGATPSNNNDHEYK